MRKLLGSKAISAHLLRWSLVHYSESTLFIFNSRHFAILVNMLLFNNKRAARLFHLAIGGTAMVTWNALQALFTLGLLVIEIISLTKREKK